MVKNKTNGKLCNKFFYLMSDEFREILVDQLVLTTDLDFDTAESCVKDFFDCFMELKKRYKDFDEQKLCASQKIDLVWQFAVLHTKLYKEFCWQFFGRFAHYTPKPFVDEFQLRLANTRYYDTLEAYRLIFGEPNKKIWPPLSNEEQSNIVKHSKWVRRLSRNCVEEFWGDDDDDSSENAKKQVKVATCLHVQLLSGNLLSLEVDFLAPLEDVAEKIYELENIEISAQRFYYKGKKLELAFSLSEHDVPDNATLELFPRKRRC